VTCFTCYNIGDPADGLTRSTFPDYVFSGNPDYVGVFEKNLGQVRTPLSVEKGVNLAHLVLTRKRRLEGPKAGS
jgi:hypothetical protein